MKDKEKLIEKLFNEFVEKDINVMLEGEIGADFTIKKAKIGIGSKTLLLTDDLNSKEFIIDLDYVTDIEIRNSITFVFENQRVIIDY